jgi:hypothetical protein
MSRAPASFSAGSTLFSVDVINNQVSPQNVSSKQSMETGSTLLAGPLMKRHNGTPGVLSRLIMARQRCMVRPPGHGYTFSQ